MFYIYTHHICVYVYIYIYIYSLYVCINTHNCVEDVLARRPADGSVIRLVFALVPLSSVLLVVVVVLLVVVVVVVVVALLLLVL